MTVEGPLRRRPDVWWLERDGEVLAYEPGRRRLHRLNPTAAAVWTRLEGDRSLDGIAKALAQEYDAPVTTVAADVAVLVADLRDEGLLTTPPRGGPPAPAPSAFSPPRTDGLARTADRLLRERRWAHELGPFRGLDFTFTVRLDDDTAARQLARILAPLTDPRASPDHQYSLRIAPGDIRLSLDGRRLGRFARSDTAVGHLLWHVNRMTIDGDVRRTVFHAAGLVDRGKGVLLPAATNSGKSTLAAALIGDGLGYLSDEAVAFAPDHDLLLPFPRALTLDRRSLTLLGIEDEHPVVTEHHVAPEAVRPGASSGPAPLSLVVSPSYERGATTESTRLGVLDALGLLLESAFHLQPGRIGFDRLVDVATEVPAYTLVFDDLADARRTIARLADASALDRRAPDPEPVAD